MACANATISAERSALAIINFARYSAMSSSAPNVQSDGAACEIATPRPRIASRRRGLRALNPTSCASPQGLAISTTS